MPTSNPGTPNVQALTPQDALAKISGLLPDEGDEPAETAADTPTPSEATPPETPDQDTPEPTERYTVVVDGADVEVDLEELKSGYRYNAHNTKTAQALADEKREMQAEREALRRERTEYQSGLSQVLDAVQQLTGEPDWQELRRSLSAEEFLKQKADWEASKAGYDRVRAQQAEVERRAAADQQAEFQRYVKAESMKLNDAMGWGGDRDKAQAEYAKLEATAKTYGYTAEDVRKVIDHRILLILRDAMRYKELHREPAPKQKTAPIKTAKPGTPDRPRPNEKYEKLRERAHTTGRSTDAARAIEALLPD